MLKLTISLASLLAIVVLVNGHGRLWSPAGRGTLWRFPQFQKYNPERDYNDVEGFCGGFHVQYNENGGNCGVCGDSYSDPAPRRHEGGGLFGRGIITGNYSAGQIIEVQIDLTASHLGYFELRLCPQNNPLVPATQECLDQYVLELADGSGTRYPIPTFDAQLHTYSVKLPEGVTCRQCVLQWHYNTGNSHGYCSDGAYKLGCGSQEVFRACADIAIN
ncbi:hypothetical protein Ocin01_06884 [Orchesella cincta]|uniref:Chitin-binding type-4 domain-containing protein n=1 Tax=Orchesella cincta TaxID=48709 RepID=A0A1D2N3G2_ORCCI|nr:hypothetical protein Ocin01_06884 [Orchesella cincta]